MNKQDGDLVVSGKKFGVDDAESLAKV